MSHKPVFTLLTTDSALTSQGMTAESVKGSSLLASPEMRPFAIAKWAETTPMLGSIGSEGFELWVYDEPGSYARINSILDRAVELLCSEVVDYVVGGERFSTATNLGRSRELYDDIFKCITRFQSFRIV